MKFASKLSLLALMLSAHFCAAQSDGQDQVKSVEKVFELIRSDRVKAKAQLDSFRAVTDLSPNARMTLLRFYGVYYAINGQLDSAEYYFRYVSDHAIPNSILRGKAIFNLSVIHKNRGQLEEALDLLGQAQKIYEEAGENRLVAEVYGEMASVNKIQGYLDISLDYLLRSIQILENSPSSSPYAITIERQKLANTYLQTGDYEFAVKIFEQVLPSFMEQKDMVNYGITEASYSLALTRTGRFEEAERAADRALEVLSGYNNNDHLALANLQKAIVLSKLNNNSGAIQYFEKALAYSSKGYGSFAHNLYLSYMQVLLAIGNTDEAYRIYQDAMARNIFKNATLQDNLRLKQLIIEQQQHELAGNALEMANLNEKIEQILERTSTSGKMSDVTRMLNNMKSGDKNWESLLLRFKKLNPDFMDKLQARFPELSQSELEFCALVKLNLSFKDIANLMNINHRSVFAKKYRITQKLKTSEDEDFYKIIREI